jgi:16S rRNA (cytosine1402-N4)-methyltransferase
MVYENPIDDTPAVGAALSQHSVPGEDVTPGHISVFATQAVDALALRPGAVAIDGTFGGGGHAERIAAQVGPDGRVICIDRDPETRLHFERLSARFPNRLVYVNATYADMARVAGVLGYERVDGVLLDLGLSSFQLSDAERGFSFMLEGPLDMRFDPATGQSAAELIATATEADLVRILFAYGEESQARRITRAILRERERAPITTTTRLAALVEKTVGRRHSDRIHPATKTFQALRIAVNDELGEVERGVQAGIDLLAPGGRFAVISFHSLEDRIVKRAFAEAARGCICPRDVPVCVCGHVATVRLIGKATRPSEAEIAANPRARSAMLRVVERLP